MGQSFIQLTGGQDVATDVGTWAGQQCHAQLMEIACEEGGTISKADVTAPGVAPVNGAVATQGMQGGYPVATADTPFKFTIVDALGDTDIAGAVEIGYLRNLEGAPAAYTIGVYNGATSAGGQCIGNFTNLGDRAEYDGLSVPAGLCINLAGPAPTKGVLVAWR